MWLLCVQGQAVLWMGATHSYWSSPVHTMMADRPKKWRLCLEERYVTWPFCNNTKLILLANAKVHSLSWVQASKAQASGVIAMSQNHIHCPHTWLDNEDPHPASITKNTLILWHSSFNRWIVIMTDCLWFKEWFSIFQTILHILIPSC